MLKHVFSCLIFFSLPSLSQAQPASGKLQWIVQLASRQIPVGIPAPDKVAILEGNDLYLLDVNGEKLQMPYDSMSYEHGQFWKIWKDGLQGIFHLDSGELIPAVYENISPASRLATNWAYSVTKYGMTAVISSENKLLLPYKAGGYQNLALISDTILEYFQKESYYFSKNGNPVPESTARMQKGPYFQRISAEQYVLTALVDGRVRKDTFSVAENFVNDIAIVKKGQWWGYLLNNGDWLLPPSYQAALPFDEMGHAVVKKDDKYGILKKDGTFLIKPDYQFLKPFSLGLFEYRVEGRSGLIDTLGNTILPPGEYGGFSMAGTACFAAKSGDSLLVFTNEGLPLDMSGLVWLSKDRYGPNFFIGQNKQANRAKNKEFKKGLMSPTGQWLIQPVLKGSIAEHKQFFIVEAAANPCCLIGPVNLGVNQPGKYLIFDTGTLQPLFTHSVDAAKPSADGHFIIFEIDKKYGLAASLYDIVPAEFDELNAMGNGWIYVRKGNNYGALKWDE